MPLVTVPCMASVHFQLLHTLPCYAACSPSPSSRSYLVALACSCTVAFQLLVTSNCCPPCSSPVEAACSLMDLSPKTPPLHPPPRPTFPRGGLNTRQTMVACTIITASLGSPCGHAPWRSPLLPVLHPTPILLATRLPYWRLVT